ncbi:hypothetical protein Nepgr_018604 [Nepenthes gracilis]|uniref:Uncharacterized protein n=1 Tax=Nepenthes gracilis TaxID=150966 RepID=A0AAD3SSI9_NEPGR|nr:hypothetical protein Nepgr_018604 [Nepenthes gracilis]
MAETTASDHLVDIAPKPAASSHDAVEPSHENEPADTGPDAREHGCCCRVCLIILYLITLPIIAVALIICCLCALLADLTFGNDVLSLTTVAKKLSGHLSFRAGGGNSGEFVFSQLKKQYEDLNWSTAATAAFRRRFLLLSLLWLVIVVSVPVLKQIKVLGLPLWKWTVLVLVVTVGYHAFSSLCQCIVKKLSRKEEDKFDVAYYADGLRRSVNNVSFWVFILLAWEHYFRSSHHGLHRYGFSEKALDIGTWTFVSLLFGKFLLLAKNAVMLSWESHAIYRQFADNIGKAGLQLYFLGLVSGEKFDIFSPRKEGNEVQKKKSENAQKFISRSWNRDDASTYHKKKMAKYFILAAKLSSRKDDNVPEKIREKWLSFKELGDPACITMDSVMKYINISEEDTKGKIYEEIYSLFEELKSIEELKDQERKNTDECKDKEVKNAEEPNEEESKDKELKNANKDQNSPSEVRIRYSTFEEWMTMAFKNCLSLGYMLSDAQSAANNLNNIMRAFIVIVVILCWLLLTGIASTKVLITIASPFLAATLSLETCLRPHLKGLFLHL